MCRSCYSWLTTRGEKPDGLTNVGRPITVDAIRMHDTLPVMPAPPPDARHVLLETLQNLLMNTPKALGDLYAAEENVRQVYSDRFVFELLQNARDAAARQPARWAAATEGERGPRALLRLDGDVLLVANEGEPFTRGGYEAVTGIGRSPKRGEPRAAGAPRLIGKKGIGFKSVLRVSGTPQVFSSFEGARLALAFGSPRIASLCARAAAMDELGFSSLLSDEERGWFLAWMAERQVPFECLSLPQLSAEAPPVPVPVMMFPEWCEEVPGDVSALLGWDGSAHPYDTVIRLPLRSGQAEEVRRHLRDDIQPEKVLFLGTLGEVRVEVAGPEAFTRIIQARRRTGLVQIDVGPDPEHMVPRDYFVASRMVPIDGLDLEPREVTVAMRVDVKTREVVTDGLHPLFNYYPLVDEGLVLPVLLHAEFEVDPGRTKFSADHRALNERLLSEAAALLAGPDGLASAIVSGTPNGRRSMPGLVLPSPSDRPLPDFLRGKVVAHLKEAKVVPAAGGGWARPAEVVWSAGAEADALERVLQAAAVDGLSAPDAEAREAPRFAEAVHALGAVAFSAAHLAALLDAGAPARLATVPEVRDLWELIEVAVPAGEGRRAFLDRWRVDGPRPTPLVPCRIEGGPGFALVAPPRRGRVQRSADGGEDGESAEEPDDAVFYRPADPRAGEPAAGGATAEDDAPPEELRVRFVHDGLFNARTGDARRVERICEDIVGVRPYLTLPVLQRLLDLPRSINGDRTKKISQFVFRFLQSSRFQQWNPARLAEAPAPESGASFAGLPGRDRDEEDARRGLGRVHLPGASGEPRPADGLRFGADWGEFELLDTLDPPSTAPLAAPSQLRAWLGVESPDPVLHAFARLLGVWETAPVGFFHERLQPPSVDGLATLAPSAADLAARLLASPWNSFGREGGYSHGHTAVTRTFWLRDLPWAASSPARSHALLGLLDRDWDALFKHLRFTTTVCPGCSSGGRYHSGRLDSDGAGAARPPSILAWSLAQEPWYHRRESAAGDTTPLSSVWRIPDPPSAKGLPMSPWRFVPHLRTDEERASPALAGLGVADLTAPVPERILDLLETLKLRQGGEAELMEPRRGASPGRAAFVAVHHELYGRLQALWRKGALPPALLARLGSIGLLAERDRALAWHDPARVFTDDGSDPVGVNRFRGRLDVACVDDHGRELAHAVGARPVKVDARPDPHGETDRSAELQAALARYLPHLVALLARVVPSGGRPIDVEGATFAERLATTRALRFSHCADLAIDLSVHDAGLHIPGSGRGDQRDLFLDASRGMLWFDHPMPVRGDAEDLLVALASPIARVLATVSYAPLFRVMFGMRDEDERVRWLEEQGVTTADRDLAADVVGDKDGVAADRAARLRRAISSVLPPGAPEEVLDDAVAGLAPADALREGGPDSALGRLEAAGVSLAALSGALVGDGLDPVNVRTHREAMAGERRVHLPALAGALLLLDTRAPAAPPEPARARAEAAFQTLPAWPLRAVVPRGELLAGVRDALVNAGLQTPPLPESGASARAWATNLAAALGVDEERLAAASAGQFVEAERQAAALERFHRRRRSWSAVGVALAAGTGEPRTDVLRGWIRDWGERVTRADGEELEPFVRWFAGPGDLAPAVARSLVDRLAADGDSAEPGTATIEALAALTGRSMLPDLIRRVRRLLDERRQRRKQEFADARQRLVAVTTRERRPTGVDRPVVPGAEPEPLVGGPGTGEIPKKRAIVPGKIPDDEAERRRRGRLGSRGEDVAFLWVAHQLLELRRADPPRFVAVVGRLRARLGEGAWTLPPTLVTQFDGASLALTRAELDDDEALDVIEELVHVSGDFGSDSFGFDLLGWDAATDSVRCLEVKTSTGAGSFHLSRTQWDTARFFGERFAVLRVVLGERKTTIAALVDPVRLAAEGGLVLTAEGFEVGEIASTSPSSSLSAPVAPNSEPAILDGLQVHVDRSGTPPGAPAAATTSALSLT